MNQLLREQNINNQKICKQKLSKQHTRKHNLVVQIIGWTGVGITLVFSSVWDENLQVATYLLAPDKETPLWDVHSQVIYYWTADTLQTDEERALIIVYHGGVYERMKTSKQAYLSFRAVREVTN